MNKELEALKTIGDLDYIDEYDCRDGNLKRHFNEEFTIVEEALQRLEAIDNSQPSKALECLERMCKVSRNKMDFNIGWVFKHEINTIKQTLLKAQEQEKVIDELKENVKRWHDTLKSKNKYASEMVVAEIEEYWAIKSGV